MKNIDEFRCKISKSKPYYEHSCKICSYIKGKTRVIDLKKSDPLKYKEIIDKRVLRDKNYHGKNKQKINARNNAYYEKNKIKIKNQRKIYRSLHPEIIREQRKKFLAKRSNKIAQSLRRRIRSIMGTGKEALSYWDVL